ALARVRETVRCVVVDDAQELTPAGVRLLRVLAAPGVDVVLVGDPDSAVQTFRGADPRWLATGWTALGDGPTVVLCTAYRLPTAIAEAAARVVGHVGVLGDRRHREVQPVREGGVVEAHLLRSGAQEAALVAATFRRAHLLDGLPWSQMAVIVRGNARTSTLRRVLATSGVPVEASSTDLPVREEPAVRPLLLLLDAALSMAAGSIVGYDPEVVVEALLSPIGGADTIGLRRLRRSLRAIELAAGGGRSSDDLLAEGVRFPITLIDFGPEAIPARRVGAVLAAGVAGARTNDTAGQRVWAPGVTAESVLWAMWSASALARPWREAALAGGPSGDRRDRDLDAVMALFDAAGRFVDRLPAAGPDAFLEHLRSQDVVGDTLAATSAAGDAVEVLTPAAAAGREWRLVVVAGVQEGVWPDLRLRGSLLRSAELVDVVTGRHGSWRSAQAAVRHDETRMFHVAVTRASERLLVTAVRSDDEQPSPYLDVVAPVPTEVDDLGDPVGRGFSEVDRALTLPTLVAALRRQVVAEDSRVRAAAVNALARLARAGVPGADPRRWWSLSTASDDRPLREADLPVRVSPSRVEGFHQCGLKWLLTSRGGDKPGVGSKDVGVLVHEVAAEHPDTADAATMRAALDAMWGRLGLPPTWANRRKHAEAAQLVERLAAYFTEARARGWERVGAETEMAVALGRARLTGRVDRIERNAEGDLRVIDYKTGSSKPKPADLPRHPQLGCYQVAVEGGAFGDLGQRSAGAGLLQLGKAATTKPVPQLQLPLAAYPDPAWAQDLVIDTAESMGGATFAATTGPHCRICPLKACCPAQPEGRAL
ncbi:MAG: ATP-dependent DNA helicase, partial [Nostocoides sp.]